MRRLLSVLAPEARPLAAWVTVLAAASGAITAGLVAIGHRALLPAGDDPGTAIAIAFAALALGKLVSGYFAEVLLTRFCHASIAHLRAGLIERALHLPLAKFEKIGAPRVFAALAEDLAAINHALAALPAVIINGAIVAAASVYLVVLSPPAFLLLAIAATIGIAVHRLFAKRAGIHWDRARATGDALHAHYRTFTDGLKELKMHRGRREAFLRETLQDTAGRYARQCVDATRRYTLAHSFSHGIFLALIAGLLFAMPGLGLLPDGALTGYVVTCLFLMGPVSGIVHTVPALMRARIARRKIEELGIDLAAELPEAPATQTWRPDWSRIGLEAAAFTHRGEGARTFTAGPVDLQIERGELLFITGPNGSGKTTLGKMLAGLYEPESGALTLDGVAIDHGNRDAFRQRISAVFADCHLFAETAPLCDGGDIAALREEAEFYLERLGLTDVVSLGDDGRFSTTRALSTGQRKRLALLAAYLEDRDVLLFDEWAADQDPTFRSIFYQRLLPELKARGKTVIVITHDDRYFGCAERLVVLADGQLSEAAPAAL